MKTPEQRAGVAFRLRTLADAIESGEVELLGARLDSRAEPYADEGIIKYLPLGVMSLAVTWSNKKKND